MSIRKIAEFAPEESEAGVGLALEDNNGRYLFFLAGTRHQCLAGELFYAGIGGHRESGEGWLECAHREAREELGTDIDILSASVTWYVSREGVVQQLELADQPRPMALYEMIHPHGTPRAGGLYRLVIYQVRLHGAPKALSPDEVRAVFALTPEQVIRGIKRKPTLGELIREGAVMVAGGEIVHHNTRLYPLGTAAALAIILGHIKKIE